VHLLAFYTCAFVGILHKLKWLPENQTTEKYREIGFNSTKIAITEIASTTDAELKLPERKRAEEAIQNLCNNVFF